MTGKNREILLYSMPFLMIVTTFIFYPLAANFYYSFHSFSAFSPSMRYVGLDNYARIFQDPVMLRATINVGLYATISVIFQVGLGLVFAAILEQAFLRPVAGFFRTLFFMPAVMSTTIVAFIFVFFYDPMSGIINSILASVGLGGWQRAWLGESRTAIYSIIAMSQWQSIGYIMMLYIVAIQNIPRDLYEAAQIDGAGPIAQFVHITVPQVREMTIVTTVITVIGSITVFSEPYILTGGGPGYSSTVLALHMYQSAFFRDEMGYAATIATVIFVATMMVSAAQLRLFGRKK